MIRRFGEAPHRDQTYRLRPGAYALLPRDGQLLLTRYLPDDEVLLPGGGIDPGESPIAALHREVWEETGWKISSPRRVGAFRRFTYMPEYELWAEKLCHVYIARPVLRLSEPGEEEHRTLWRSIPDALQILENPGDRHFTAFLARSG